MNTIKEHGLANIKAIEGIEAISKKYPASHAMKTMSSVLLRAMAALSEGRFSECARLLEVAVIGGKVAIEKPTVLRRKDAKQMLEHILSLQVNSVATINLLKKSREANSDFSVN